MFIYLFFLAFELIILPTVKYLQVFLFFCFFFFLVLLLECVYRRCLIVGKLNWKLHHKLVNSIRKLRFSQMTLSFFFSSRKSRWKNSKRQITAIKVDNANLDLQKSNTSFLLKIACFSQNPVFLFHFLPITYPDKTLWSLTYVTFDKLLNCLVNFSSWNRTKPL